MVRMYGDVGVRESGMFDTSVVRTCERSAARNRISLMTCGHASASTQMCMGLKVVEGRHGFAGTPRALAVFEERHGFAGALRTLGGVGGHFGAPHVLRTP